MILGSGSYGEVSARNGNAVKKFTKLTHLIQEYMALQYLDDCHYVVRSKGVNFNKLELYMELYDDSLRKWLYTNSDPKGNSDTYHKNIMKITHDILRGLIELHDRGLAHGDLKPGNILVRENPLKAVLGDCGFVSIAKYAKVDRTAAVYRDPVISYDISHDMFSFGICFLEMVGEIKINRQATYEELKRIIEEKIRNPDYRKIIYNLVHEDKGRRPSARNLLFYLFKQSPPVWVQPNILSKYQIKNRQKNRIMIVSVINEHREFIRKLMKAMAHKYEINRAKKGYGALISYIDNNNIEFSSYKIYTAVTLMILSAIFGKSGFREAEAIKLCENKYDLHLIYKILENLLSDFIFVSILLGPTLEIGSTIKI